MQAAATRGADDEYRGLVIGVRYHRSHMRAERLIGEHLVHAADRFLGGAEMVADVNAEARNGSYNERSGLAALGELLDHQHAENAGAEHEAEQRQQKALLPMF